MIGLSFREYRDEAIFELALVARVQDMHLNAESARGLDQVSGLVLRIGVAGID
jgi:hypothetical protein